MHTQAIRFTLSSFVYLADHRRKLIAQLVYLVRVYYTLRVSLIILKRQIISERRTSGASEAGIKCPTETRALQITLYLANNI